MRSYFWCRDECYSSKKLTDLNQNFRLLLARIQALNSCVEPLVATANVAQAEIAERKADMRPGVCLRAERQMSNFFTPVSLWLNVYFLGCQCDLGPVSQPFCKWVGPRLVTNRH